MRRCILICIALFLMAGRGLAAEQTLDDFLAIPERVADIKTIMLVIASQTDPAVADKNAAELRRSYWAARPEAGLAKDEAELELMKFDNAWKQVADVVRQRNMTAITFVGMDLVLLKRAQDWYFGNVTPRGPVLIKVSVQYNANTPLTVHGVQVYTKWDDVKAVSAAMQMPAGTKVLGVTYKPKSDPEEKTEPDKKGAVQSNEPAPADAAAAE